LILVKKGKMIRILEKYKVFSWIVVAVIASSIFYISSLQFSPGSGGFGWMTVAYHFLAFFSLAFFLFPALVNGKKSLIIVAVILAFLYGVSDEIHQLFVPGRNFAVSDILINSCGILFASLIYTVSLKYRKRE
jgi:glycopeptide antibiotics resistance protein